MESWKRLALLTVASLGLFALSYAYGRRLDVDALIDELEQIPVQSEES